MKNITLIIILALNIFVYLGWNLVSSEAGLVFMIQNFLVSWNSVAEGRWWTLLTTVFSHASLVHLLFNMLALMSFARVMIYVLGTRNFIIFYLIAGLMGSFVHIFTSNFLIHNPDMNALGASGAVSGVILLFSLLFPEQKLLIMGIIPIRAIWGALLLVGLDLWGLITQTHGGGFPIGHGAHLGGALVGLVYFFKLRTNRRTRGPQF